MLTLVMAMPSAMVQRMHSRWVLKSGSWETPGRSFFSRHVSELRRHEPSLWNSYRYRGPPEAAVVEADGADGAEAGAEAWAPPAE